ncbi:hypothetical protein [Motilimonas sp. E26]|uniref:hypothetical protein n=1 Tax=Motilimonas sp. E26 TaxID=2865674 RepID=UPI001E4D9F37|nr:hypothetical protein [Motilimonas sp. E26]MCE0556708.1 hypothetical protein [Motilimonas sp. E26]
MNSSLNVPTDNPYKLMAIVGAITFVFGIYFLLSQTYKYNDAIFQALEKISIIQAQDELPEKVKNDRVAIENRKIEIVTTDSKYFPFLCSVISAIGLILCGIGFYHWIYNVYPDEESIRKEQLKSLRIANQSASRTRLTRRA